jgi:hypothetical protein
MDAHAGNVFLSTSAPIVKVTAYAKTLRDRCGWLGDGHVIHTTPTRAPNVGPEPGSP